jgi:hypothetical protein
MTGRSLRHRLRNNDAGVQKKAAGLKRPDIDKLSSYAGRARAGLEKSVEEKVRLVNQKEQVDTSIAGFKDFEKRLTRVETQYRVLGTLADVVQSYAGGVYLDTVFIDEGFGSLDAESLDYAVQLLFNLQTKGHLVAVISNVAELRERIDTRLEVIAGKTGSNARFVRG